MIGRLTAHTWMGDVTFAPEGGVTLVYGDWTRDLLMQAVIGSAAKPECFDPSTGLVDATALALDVSFAHLVSSLNVGVVSMGPMEHGHGRSLGLLMEDGRHRGVDDAPVPTLYAIALAGFLVATKGRDVVIPLDAAAPDPAVTVKLLKGQPRDRDIVVFTNRPEATYALDDKDTDRIWLMSGPQTGHLWHEPAGLFPLSQLGEAAGPARLAGHDWMTGVFGSVTPMPGFDPPEA